MKRKLLMATMLLMVVFTAFAEEITGVSMVSYEQSWMDREGTLSLKNETNEDVWSVAFQIIYMDMNNNPMDYQDYYREVNIAPGMVKKVDIPAYENSRNYSYFKSESMPGGGKSFTIKFVLKEINVSENPDVAEEDDEYDDYEDAAITYGAFVIIFAIIIISVSVGLYVLVALMARNRERSPVLWVLLSFFITPIVTIILLLVLGKDKNGNFGPQ